MPTGYTACVQSGEVTEFADFAMQCARAFGALIHMREDDLDAPIGPPEPSSYHIKAEIEARAEHSRLLGLTATEVVAEHRAEVEKCKADAVEIETKRRAERGRYLSMLAKANGWTPPTKDHEGLREFMVKQLTESIEHDCQPLGGDWLKVEPDPTKWHAAKIARAAANIDYHADEHAKDVARNTERWEWFKKLRDSLAQPA